MYKVNTDFFNKMNHIGGVMLSVVERGFQSRSGQTKDYKTGSCCFFAKHAAFRKKRTDWLAQNQDNVSEWDNMYIHQLLFQRVNTIKIQLLSVLV